MEYLNFHETALELKKTIIEILFDIKDNSKVAIMQTFKNLSRNHKNPNQVLVEKKPEILINEYNVFDNGKEAFEALKDFVFDEFKIDTFDLKNFVNKVKSKSLYFYIFSHFDDEKPKLRGVFYATTKTHKPSFWVALIKNLEYEYDREIYKK